MITKILVPVDFNDQSRGAVREAIVFAQAFGAAVEVAHLWRRPGTQPPGAERAINEFSESEQGAQMRHYLDSLEQHGVDVRARLQVVHDEPYRAIVELAEREDFDLIVIGTHGRTGVSHLLHGSVAERVVRHAGCPVLSVRIPEPPRARRNTVPIPVADGG